MEAAAMDVLRTTVFSRLDLLQLGYRPKQITRAVRDGTLIRLRRDHYVVADANRAVARAVRIGGRLTCISAIALAAPEVFVFAAHRTHVQVPRAMSRLRMPDDSRTRWMRGQASEIRLHWSDATDPSSPAHMVSLHDAVREMARCLPTREVIATIDSLLHVQVMTMPQVREAFSGLPARCIALLEQVDGRAESGPETLQRLILRELPISFEPQVWIPGVGRVDFVVDGFLILECDSKAHHEGWVKQRDDRRRDLAAAEQGYVTLRVLAEDLLHHPDRVASAIRGLLAARSAWSYR
ncbi:MULTISPECIES: DUF559 domain-containing protein [unclassified Microbacterium]|uniref:endonuclease domain-containing protein n=1 Tax=unclassified Microbacterium TaxID=2609290 RepID=UPI00214AB3DB|nr:MULTISPECIES: DUF559 domain-containing protein [unclassified Microbacterium]MCR2808855.1 DUF559 domain-containing protein [Microbacterium sp. zg.B185]WIM18726.1 DUF559 domain-containing protein [Microbacterium sp. zg-B185]